MPRVPALPRLPDPEPEPAARRAYQGNLGGKTGFTDAARHTFVTAAERDGRRLVVSVMDTENAPLRAADQAALLLDWGFAVPAGTEGSAGSSTRATWSPTPSPTRRRAAAAAPSGPAAADAGGGRVPLVPVALAGAAVLIVARRWSAASRSVPSRDAGRRRSDGAGTASGEPTPPRPGGGSPSTPP